MVHLNDINLSFGGQKIFELLSWHIKPKKRIGLIGPNGAGKTTLLRIVSGQQDVDDGTVAMASTTRIGYLEQDVQESDLDRSVLDETLQAFAPILDLQQQVEIIADELAELTDHQDPRYLKLLRRMELVQTELASHEVHMIRPRAESVLSGLGFDADELERPLSTFSGGWRMRVSLAKLLLQQPDVLLLDEPTNHLDIESIDWLETYLKGYEGTVILVSHDRYFLDRMVTTIAELAHGRITEYAGNYSFYLNEREERRVLQRAAYENQQRYIKETERFIERFRYKNTKARQVQSRIKTLEKLDRIPPPESDEVTIHFRFPDPPRSGRVVLELSTFTKTYPNPDGPDTVVFKKARDLRIERGDKIALIGKNGAGKSTLARILRGIEPFDGERTEGYQVDMAYFAQHQAESLAPNQTVLEALQSHARGQTETQVRNLLGAFLFRGDDVFKPIGVLSGGERSRVALARTLLSPANFLILDEPTNHLDMLSKSVLIEALKQYSGTFVIVSHDRHFLDQVVKQVWYVADQTARPFLGTYTDFQWKLQQQNSINSVVPSSKKNTTPSAPEPTSKGGRKTKEQKRLEAEARNRRYKERQQAQTDALDTTPEQWRGRSTYQLRQMLKKIEEHVEQAESRKEELETKLADPDFYANPAQSNAAIQAFNELEQELARLYERWENLASYLENASVDPVENG